MPDPLVTVVIPVKERPAALMRALLSVSRQTLQDLECIVVDDASDADLRHVVESLGDERFRIIRRERNGGPYAARFTALPHVRGQIVAFLDSDHEFYPWALAQAHRHFGATPEADVLCALHVRNADSRLFVRVKSAPRLVRPEEFRLEPSAPDRVGFVRRNVVDEWIERTGDYFALEGQVMLVTNLRHTQLYLDEPWTLYHTDEPDRVTMQTPSNRVLDDYVTFLDEQQELIADPRPCVRLDELLQEAYFKLWRGRRREASTASEALRMRNLSPTSAIARVAWSRVRDRAPWKRNPVTWI